MIRRTVPYTADEKQSLYVSLDRHRDVVLWKLDGLDDERLRRPMTPSGTNLMIEETARHVGHMDILRELLDGAAGDHPEN
jgi:Protein of unknown function (DUF664)